jgi:hypothetical protein
MTATEPRIEYVEARRVLLDALVAFKHTSERSCSSAPRPPGSPTSRHSGNSAALKAKGVEGAVVDFDPIEIVALEPADTRRIAANVAGPAPTCDATTWE